MKIALHVMSIAILTALLTACNSSDDEPVLVIVDIPSSPNYCWSSGEDTMRFMPLCLPNGSRNPNYSVTGNSISNFRHTFGTAYSVEVEIEEIENPPADGLSIAITFVRILTEEADPVGTTYEYAEFELFDNPITKNENGNYQIFPYEFLCADDIDCDALVDIADDGGIVSIEITRTGGEIPATITYWN